VLLFIFHSYPCDGRLRDGATGGRLRLASRVRPSRVHVETNRQEDLEAGGYRSPSWCLLICPSPCLCYSPFFAPFLACVVLAHCYEILVGAVHACVMRACASHARVACTCCACPCCACPRCALSCGVWCACAALIYIVWSSPTPSTPRLAMTFTLSPFSVTYACSCHALFLPLFPISCLCCCLPFAMSFNKRCLRGLI
jgi:hypothetical protein